MHNVWSVFYCLISVNCHSNRYFRYTEGGAVDWIDYKRFVAKYRINYDNKGCHVSMLLSSAVSSYCEYRSCSIEGKLEYICIDKFGEFLYHLAEIESMIHGVQYERLENFDDNDWGMVEMASNISRGYNNQSIACHDMQILVSKWLRAYFPLIYCNRSYSDALVASVRQLQEKHGH